MAKFYDTRPDCGANLDPGETCDCKQQYEPIESVTPAGREELDRKVLALFEAAQALQEKGDIRGAFSTFVDVVLLYIQFIELSLTPCESWKMPFVAAALTKLEEVHRGVLSEHQKQMRDLLIDNLQVDAAKVEVRR